MRFLGGCFSLLVATQILRDGGLFSVIPLLINCSSNSYLSVSLLYHTFVNKSRRKPCIDTRRLVIPSLRSLHPQLVAVYHPHKSESISSFLRVYHQAAGRCTLTRDDIQLQRGCWYAPRIERRWYAKPVAWINKKELSVDKSSFFVGTPNGNRTHN